MREIACLEIEGFICIARGVSSARYPIASTRGETSGRGSGRDPYKDIVRTTNALNIANPLNSLIFNQMMSFCPFYNVATVAFADLPRSEPIFLRLPPLLNLDHQLPLLIPQRHVNLLRSQQSIPKSPRRSSHDRSPKTTKASPKTPT